MRRSLQLVDATAQLLDLGPSALRFQAFALLRTRHPRLFALLWRARTASACLADLFKAECTVLVLTARLSRDHGDAGRHVTHADGRVGRVHALSARTRRTERLHVAVARKLVVVHAREGSEVAVCQAVMFHGVNATASLRSQAWKPAFAAHSGERKPKRKAPEKLGHNICLAEEGGFPRPPSANALPLPRRLGRAKR